MKIVQISKTITLTQGGIQYRGALVQGDHYRVEYNSVLGGLSIQSIKSGYVVFSTVIKTSRKQGIALADAAREALDKKVIHD